MKKLYRFLFALLTISPVSIVFLHAQEQSTQHARYAGKDFWITMAAFGASDDFFFTSRHNATLTFVYTANNSSFSANIPANTVVKMVMPQMQLTSMFNMETIQNRSLHIISDSDVVVQFAGWGDQSDDGALIYPSDRQKYGNVYYLNGLPFLGPSSGFTRLGSFSVVATCDSVKLEITPARDMITHPAGTPFTINLNRGQTYAMASAASNAIKDLSGTKIEVKQASCCNPINVFNTGDCGFSYWPYNGAMIQACDNFYEQLLPVSSWDTSYYVLPYCNNPYTIIKIVSSGNNNTLSWNGNIFATLNEGGTLDTIIRDPVHIASSFPISVSQHMVSQLESYESPVIYPTVEKVDSLSDPNSAMTISMRDGIRDSWFQTVGQTKINSFGDTSRYNYFHALAIVSKTSNVGSIMLNSASVASQFYPFPNNPGYSYAYIKPDTGVIYHLTSSDKIVANYYAAAYCGSIDFALGDAEPYTFFDEPSSVDTLNVCAGFNASLEALAGSSHQWSTGESSASINVTDTGQYSVLTYQDDNCIGKLKRFVIRYRPGYINPIDLADTVICIGEQVVLNGHNPSTVWSTGFTGEQISVHEPGLYWATATDTCTLDMYTDTMTLSDDICLWKFCNFNFPNAFSPNGDGLNDVLMPVYYGDLDKYRLNIFNRLGQRVFSTAKLDEGWNGLVNGKPADVGVYFYYCTFYCPVRGNVKIKGDVTLIR